MKPEDHKNKESFALFLKKFNKQLKEEKKISLTIYHAPIKELMCCKWNVIFFGNKNHLSSHSDLKEAEIVKYRIKETMKPEDFKKGIFCVVFGESQ